VLGKTTKKPETKQDRAPSEASGDTSVISRDMSVIGDCSTGGRLRIHGRISGDVTARGLELTSTGSVGGDLIAYEGGDSHLFVIDGAVEGTVRATRVEVRGNGTVTGGIVADDVVVHGRVRGGILARNRLALEDTAAVEGNVRALRLALKEGGQVNGTIQMGEDSTTGLLEGNGESAKIPKKEAPRVTAERGPPGEITASPPSSTQPSEARVPRP